MSDAAAALETASPEPAAPRARRALMKRLADVVCLPGSRVNAFERAMTADLLVEMLRDAAVGDRVKVARRLSNLTEIPHTLLRLLLADDIAVARPLLEDCLHLPDGDLVRCARDATPEHRRLIAQRRHVGELLSEALVEAGETPVVEALLRNDKAELSQPGVEMVVAATRDQPELIPHLLRRPELRPSHAYVMFWWADGDARRIILQRFAVSREVLQEAAADVFPMMAEEGWQDPLARKALQFIERRQRNRAAVERSPYENLEAAVEAHASGLTRHGVEEISYLSGLKPTTGAKIFTDPGGEPLAVLCKATGLPKASLRQLWRGLRRPETDESGGTAAGFERVLIAYDTIAVDRAQTVLRYWNWALSSALTPALMRVIRSGDDEALDQHSPPERAARLVFGADLSR